MKNPKTVQINKASPISAHVFSIVIGSLVLLCCCGYVLKSSIDGSDKVDEKEKRLAWSFGAGRQLRTPSIAEVAKAKELLKTWNKLSTAERNRMSPDLIIGNALLGLDKPTVRQYLGKPSEFYTKEPNQWAFDYTKTEDWRFLILRFHNDKVSEAFLLVNH